MTCGSCEGHGHFTETRAVSVVGVLEDSVDWGAVSGDAREALELVGVANLAPGDADISAPEVEDVAQSRFQLRFRIRVPAGGLRVRIKRQEFDFLVVGKTARAFPKGPFFERLVEAGARLLRKARSGLALRATVRIARAVRFDLIRAAVHSASTRPFPEAARELAKAYPSLTRDKAEGWILDAQHACKNALRWKAGKARRGYLLLAAPSVVAWFGLGLREKLQFAGLAWPDLLVLLGLSLLGMLFVRTFVVTHARRIAFETRPTHKGRWLHFRRARNHLPRPATGSVRLALALCFFAALSLEVASGLDVYRNASWERWREPWEDRTAELWQGARERLEPYLTSLREQLSTLQSLG